MLPDLRAFLVDLGSSMTVAGESVDAVRVKLVTIARAYGVTDVDFIVLPLALFVQTGTGETARLQMRSQVNRTLRFDQIAELYRLADHASRALITPTEGLAELRRIRATRPRFGWVVRTLGHAVLTTGLAFLLQPTETVVIFSFVLGLLIGLLKLPNLPTLRLVFPVIASFIASTIIFVASRHIGGMNPIRALIPPIATFLPGGMLTTGTVELAAGQMISGASRLVTGIVQLMLLAFGIVAAAAVVDVPSSVLVDNPVTTLGWWAPWVGLLILAIGNYLHFSAPVHSLPYILIVLVVAFLGQRFGAEVFSAELSGFFGALAMTPVVLWFDGLRNGPPALITFLPGFWMLVPGAVGLIGVTQIVGSDPTLGLQDFAAALTTIVSIALGVLIGTSAYRTFDAGYAFVQEALPIPLPDLHGPPPDPPEGPSRP